MIKAVIFDMYETLITHYRSPLYFGVQMAADAGISESVFLPRWRKTEQDRTLGRVTFEEVIEAILKENNCYTKQLFHKIVEKRIATQTECFHHLHEEIIPMLTALKGQGMRVGLISNCFSEEAKIIRQSELFPYFDVECLSYEQGVAKPDEEIYHRCMEALGVRAEECIYVGDGGSRELETAGSLGMRVVQAVWYGAKRMEGFVQIMRPMDIIGFVEVQEGIYKNLEIGRKNSP